MTRWSRRSFLANSAAGATMLMASGRPTLAQSPGNHLSSDIGSLRRVLVHGVSPQDIATDRLGTRLLPNADTDLRQSTVQHEQLFVHLRQAGTEVLQLRDMLASAMAETRPSGVFETWLRTAFPALSMHAADVGPDALLGRDPRFRFRLGADGSYRHVADDTASTIFTRDSAVMTPQGMLICRAASLRRRRENMLLRFVYAHAPELRRYPIAFDAVAEGMAVEGGDMMIVDDRTMLLGVGNRTDPRIAPVLARRLNMDVVTVQTAPAKFLVSDPTGRMAKAQELRVLLLHLDTFFTLVAPRHGLVVPWLMEHEHSEDNPLVRYIRGAQADTRLAEDEAEFALEMLKDFGKVRMFQRGNGREEDLGELKLVDWLRKANYRLTFVGGTRPSEDQAAFSHFMEIVYPELRRQGCNVVQARPGRVIAYAGNDRTTAALRADGVESDLFEARELWAWHGGPHCLTQPLERA